MAPREGTKRPGTSPCPFGSRRTGRRLERPLPVGTRARHPPEMLWEHRLQTITSAFGRHDYGPNRDQFPVAHTSTWRVTDMVMGSNATKAWELGDRGVKARVSSAARLCTAEGGVSLYKSASRDGCKQRSLHRSYPSLGQSGEETEWIGYGAAQPPCRREFALRRIAAHNCPSRPGGVPHDFTVRVVVLRAAIRINRIHFGLLGS
eukprot:3172447-Prymnesium_polylepis.1